AIVRFNGGTRTTIVANTTTADHVNAPIVKWVRRAEDKDMPSPLSAASTSNKPAIFCAKIKPIAQNAAGRKALSLWVRMAQTARPRMSTVAVAATPRWSNVRLAWLSMGAQRGKVVQDHNPPRVVATVPN